MSHLPERWISAADLAALVRRHFGDLPLVSQRTAFAIALAESGGDINGHNDVREDSRGLWQINIIGNPRFSSWNLYDPEQNARAARILHDGSSGWCPWSAYEEFCCRFYPPPCRHRGTYRNYLAQAVAALPDGGPPIPPPRPEPIPNGQLATYEGANRVWVVSAGRRRWVVSTPVFWACGYRLQQIRFYPRERVLATPLGQPISGPPDCPYGRPLARGSLAPAALLLLGGGALALYGARRRGVL